MLLCRWTGELWPLSLHDALPIYEGWLEIVTGVAGRGVVVRDDYVRRGHVAGVGDGIGVRHALARQDATGVGLLDNVDRKSTRLNSSHRCISYAVFCLKKKRSTLL